MVYAEWGKDVILEQPSSITSRTTSAGAGRATDVITANGLNQLRFVPSSMPSASQFCSDLPAKNVMFRPKEFMESNAEYRKLYLKQEGPKKRLLKVRFVKYSLTKTCTPIYYHIHKNGGTVMNIKNHPLVDAYYTPREHQLGKDLFYKQAKSHMKLVYENQNYQQRVRNDSHITMPFFSFIRDPVSRFISGIGQALKLNRLKPCNKLNNTIDLFDCVLTKMNTKSTYLDEHLLPQVFHLYTGLMGLDIQVRLIDLSSATLMVDWLVEQLFRASDGNATKSRRTSEYLRYRKTSHEVHGFNLSFDVLTLDMISRICSVYMMDVVMIEKTNVTKTICGARKVPALRPQKRTNQFVH